MKRKRNRAIMKESKTTFRWTQTIIELILNCNLCCFCLCCVCKKTAQKTAYRKSNYQMVSLPRLWLVIIFKDLSDKVRRLYRKHLETHKEILQINFEDIGGIRFLGINFLWTKNAYSVILLEKWQVYIMKNRDRMVLTISTVTADYEAAALKNGVQSLCKRGYSLSKHKRKPKTQRSSA